MKKYFDDSWEIIIFKEFNLKSKDEAHPLNENDHYHLVGHILARKKYKRRIHRYKYKIKVGIKNDFYNYDK